MRRLKNFLPLICAVVVLCTTAFIIFHRNYVFYTSSPGNKYNLIGIPEQDVGRTKGSVFIVDKKNKKRFFYYSIWKYDESVFLVSDSGILFQIRNVDLENYKIDPVFDWHIVVHKPDDSKPDTIYNNNTTLVIPPVFSIYKRDDIHETSKFNSGFKREKFQTEAISYYGDSLRISYEEHSCYFSLSSGKYLGLKETKIFPKEYKTISFKLVLMDGKERDELFDSLNNR